MIEWGAFITVLAAALVAACGIVTLYSLGLRLLDGAGRPRRVAGIACFVFCASIILYGVYLVVPFFHTVG